jgi:CRISPR-associated protein Cmr6
MNRPLYKALEGKPNHSGHAGLSYEKYGDFWGGDGQLLWNLKAVGKNTPKLAWVTSASARGVAPQLVADLLVEHHTRIQALCTGHNAVQLNFKTTSRLVIGIGQDHPIENGFLWHPTLGVPYIPGSSIKGMLRNWMLAWEDRGDVTSWFESGAEKGVGELIFLDALPLEVLKLEADVITPHYGPYYRDPTGNTPPADWHSPVPTPFLTVAAGAKFAVRVIQRRSKAGQSSDFEKVKDALAKALSDALDTLGIGAKTAVGYGRLAPMSKAPDPALLPRAADPFAEFKAFCKVFGSIAGNKGSQSQLVQKLSGLADDIRPRALDYMRNELNTKPRDCIPSLKTLLFPEA